ncbi:MAG: hypothetical protein OHK0013_35490 [Sandaracinaceae bacterium]
MAKQRFELVEGGSRKFWEVAQQGNDLVIAWGRIGSAGQSQTKSFASKKAAVAALAKLIAEKTKKGYAPVVASGASSTTSQVEEPIASAETSEETPTEGTATAAARSSEAGAEPSEAAAKPSEAAAKPSEAAAKPSETAASPPGIARTRSGDAAASPQPDAIVWTEEARRLLGQAVRPTLEGTLPSGDDATLLDVVRAWVDSNPFHVPTPFNEHHRVRKNLMVGRELADADGIAALERLLAYADGKLPASFDVERDAAVLALVHDHDARLALVALLLRHTGAEATFDALTALYRFERRSQNGDSKAFPEWVMRLPNPAEHSGLHGSERALVALRAAVSPTTWAALEARAAVLREHGSLALRIALALAFDRDDWAQADAREMIRTGRSVSTGYHLASKVKDELVGLASIRVGARAPHRPDPILTVERLGFDALPYLALLVGDDAHGNLVPVAHALSVLQCVRSAQLLATLLEKKGSSSSAQQKEQVAVVQRYFAARPDLAVRALGPIAVGRSKIATKVEPILKAALRTHPALLGTFAGELEPRVLAHLQGFVEAPATQASSARAEDVPSVLREPPWKMRATTLPTLKLEIPAPQVPPEADFAGVEMPRTRDDWRAFTLGLDARTHRKAVQEWLLRFPRAAATGLLPLVFGAPGKSRDLAQRALRIVLAKHREVVVEAARAYGPEAEAALAAFEASPPDIFPAKLPALPAYLDLAVLPPLALKQGGALPPDAVQSFLVLLALSPLDEPLVSLGEAKEALDPNSAARFAWDLFQQWLSAGASTKDVWCFTALGHLGDDESARRLTPLLRAWPGEAAHARAVVGLDVLAAIGTDVALMHLHGIAQKLQFKGLQEKAREKIEQIAEARGLTAAELADRLVPDLDLDADGSRTLDFGARQFRVTFDEALRPLVRDANGKVLGDLPKPAKTDDAALAKTAIETWKALKTDAKAIATSQVARLEQLMCTERRLTAETFRLFFLQHPLMIHLVRRLVWGVYDDGRLASTFRVAEDRSLADADDTAFALAEGATVGLVHRLELSPELAAKWGSIFADYEIVQPFEQLGRATHEASEEEERSTRIARGPFKAKTRAVLGLESRGWRKGENEQGVIRSMIKPIRGTLHVELPIDEGIFLGSPEDTGPEQEITYARLLDDREEVPFSRLGRVAMSELLRDLESLRGCRFSEPFPPDEPGFSEPFPPRLRVSQNLSPLA